AGRGQVLQVATTADPKWTTLPLRPVFVPLMQRILAYLSLGDEARTVRTAGEAIVIRDVATGSRWTVTTPDGQSFAVPVEQADSAVSAGGETPPDSGAEPTGERLVWPSTRLAGGYRFSSADGQVIWTAVSIPAAD